uniref:YEATS domain-containing protein n=1 Tax=Spongospora subterranea TaxID=70186 RepID=A0A0H5R655_9EUKA|eukprot:CRZ09613.1 hypothetical protein [Spongospora subterranea]
MVDDASVAVAPAHRVIARPFVHGSLAYWLGPDADSANSHKWTIYVRGLTPDDDLSTIVRQVVVQLHESFPCSTRVLDKPPYEVTEFGWGEFVATVKVYFHDRSEGHVEFSHPINLFHPSGLLSVKKPVLTEFYDEFVFSDPSESMALRLAQTPVPVDDSQLNPFAYNLEQFVIDEKNEIGKLAQCHLNVLNAIQELKKRFDKTHYEGLRYRKLIASSKKKEP